MAYEKIENVQLISLGGVNKTTRKDNPTELEGYYLRSEQRQDKFNKDKIKNMYVFKTEQGETGVIAPTDLDRQMKQAVVGLMTLVQLVGEEDVGKGNPMKVFEVSQDETRSIGNDTKNQYKTVGEDSDNDSAEETTPPPVTKLSTVDQNRMDKFMAAKRRS